LFHKPNQECSDQIDIRQRDRENLTNSSNLESEEKGFAGGVE
jgi:hypothetical protein